MLSLLAKPVAEKILADVETGIVRFKEKTKRAPKLMVILVGENPASIVYTTKKGEAAKKHGMLHETLPFAAAVSPEEVRAVIARLNKDPKVDGILIQRPLPKQFIEEEVVYWITPSKDVDSFHPENTGRLVLGLPCLQPCTPTGVMEILEHYKIPVAGKTACIVGRSSIVGKPMAALLLQADATILQTHSRTPDLAAVTRQADILVAAIGKPNFIGASHVKPGATVIDVGINRLDNGKLAGDVDFAAVSQIASAITPVPGGVGPMTIAILLRNTLIAAERAAGIRPNHA